MATELDEAYATVDQLTKERDAVISERDQRCAAARGEVADLTKEIADLRSLLAHVKAERNSLRDQISRFAAAHEELTKEPANLKEVLSKRSLDALQDLPVHSMDGTIKFPTS